MKPLMIHLSDIHYHEGKNDASGRLKHVPAAVQNLDVDIAGVLVIVSGDVAFSGKHEEYELAQRDLAELLNDIGARFERTPVHFVAVPGNHRLSDSNPDLVVARLNTRRESTAG
jgi:3',5'-cyclic AMP phosphodiesterase CpdA